MTGERIRIDLERSGGFAGVSLRTSVDTAELPPEEAREITSLVEGVDFEALARQPGAPPRQADRFQYDLVVTRGGQRQRLSLPESTVPDALRPLLEHLVARARKR